MKTIYVKFLHPEDVYAVDEFYDLVPPGDDFIPPKTCSRCGDTLYIPIELSGDTEAAIPGPDYYKPFPKENPFSVIPSVPSFPTLAVSREISHFEVERLKRFYGIISADHNGFEMQVEAISSQPVRHECRIVEGGESSDQRRMD